MRFLTRYKRALLISTAVALYLKFLLIPTGVLFYELHHATGIDFIYWGYSIFKGAGYYFGVWEYQTLTCVLVGVGLFAIAVLRGTRVKNTQNMS